MREDTRHEDRRQTLTLVEDLCDRYGPELTGDELETLANALLKVHGPDEEYPHLLDEDAPEGGPGFAVHSLDDEASLRARDARQILATPPASLPGAMRLRAARLVTAANLIGRRRQVAKLRLCGYAPPEIAALLGLERAVVYAEWRNARRALRAAFSSGDRERGWATDISSADARELFRSEQRKRIYRKPSHCAQGKEKCRRAGVCAYGG